MSEPVDSAAVAAAAAAAAAAADEAPGTRQGGQYLSSLAVEDLREYDALVMATVCLLIGLLLAVKCGKVLSRIQAADAAARDEELLLGSRTKSSALGTQDSARRRRRKKKGKKNSRKSSALPQYQHQSDSSDEDEDIDDLEAEEKAFLDSV